MQFDHGLAVGEAIVTGGANEFRDAGLGEDVVDAKRGQLGRLLRKEGIETAVNVFGAFGAQITVAGKLGKLALLVAQASPHCGGNLLFENLGPGLSETQNE